MVSNELVSLIQTTVDSIIANYTETIDNVSVKPFKDYTCEIHNEIDYQFQEARPLFIEANLLFGSATKNNDLEDKYSQNFAINIQSEINGGMVAKKKYSINYNRIAGYGRPLYDLRATCQYGDCNADVAYLQKRLMAKGYTLPKYGADGDFGNETLTALKMFMYDNDIKQGMFCTPECWKKLM